MRKPAACVGCPLYGNGEGFVPDEIIPNAKVDVWLQNPGQSEEKQAKPAIGATGDLLNESLLPTAGLTRGSDVSIRNVLRCRFAGGNDLPSGKTLEGAIAHCRVHDVPTGAQVSVACGAAAWRKFNGPGTITDWRGFTHPTLPVVATLHPTDLFRNPKMRLPVMQDFEKVDLFQKGVWPEETPPFATVRDDNGIEFVQRWVAKALKAPFVVIDTEFTRDTRWLTTIGLGYPGADGMQVWLREFTPVGRKLLRDCLVELVGAVPIVFQNAMADVPVLEKNLGIVYSDYLRIEDTMLAHAVLWSEWDHTLEYLASVYGKHRKMKHLAQTNPELYNWGDVVDTASAWQGLTVELRRDVATETIYRSQSLPLIPIILKRAKRGLRVDQRAVADACRKYEGLRQEAQTLAFAGTGWLINIGSDDQLKRYCYEWNKWPVQKHKDTKKPTVGGDAITTLRTHVGPPPDLETEAKDGLSVEQAIKRIQEGADPVLESRVIYSDAEQVFSHFLRPLKDQERVYPSMKIHAQASGRWSITDPPLQQYPVALHKLFIPDPGETWIGWDWDQIELRLLAALATDEPYLEAFRNGWDVHTLNACAIFDLPKCPSPNDPMASTEWVLGVGWAGKDDPRRVFAKRFVYRLNYGGEASTAGDIPGAKQLGLTARALVTASNRYLAAHPALAAWRVQIAADAKTTKTSRTFMGRRRRLLGDSRGAVREAYNHPMQGGVSDILNTCIIQIADALPSSTLVYTQHDAGIVAVPSQEVDQARGTIAGIVGQEWRVGGVRLAVPAKFKEERYGA